MANPSARNNIARAFKDAGFWTLVAFGLFLPLIGFRAVPDIRNELALETRWPLLFSLVAIVAAGRLIHNLVIAPWRERRGRRLAARTAVAVPRWRSRLAGVPAPFAVGFALVYPAIAVWLAGPGGSVKWIDNFGIQILIYVMLGFGLNIVVGLAGLLDLGYVAFYAVGAYAYALLAQNFGLSFFMLLPLAGILAAFWGLLLGFPVLRLRGDYLAIVTLAFGEIIRLVLINWQSLTGGPNGIASIPRPSFFGLAFADQEGGFAATFGLDYSPTHRVVFMFYLILLLALVTNAFTLSLRRLPIGRA